MKLTSIEWTDMSTNPLRYKDASGKVVWACIKKSTGCAGCYAEQIALRWSRGKVFNAANMEPLTPFVDDDEIKHIISARTIGGQAVAGKRCFLGDMTDIFGEWVPFELIDRIFAAMAMRPDVTFQILTKRPYRMAEYIERTGKSINILDAAARTFGYTLKFEGMGLCQWPLPNVWLGTSVENQATADERIPHLLKAPAAVRFLSCEPLLGPVNLKLSGYIPTLGEPNPPRYERFWVIVGGESGPNARPMLSDWAYSLRDQCQAAGVPFFFKQFSEWVDAGCREFGTAPGKHRVARMDGTFYPEGEEPQGEDAPAISMSRIGVKRAGRLLGMKEYNEFPKVTI